jgi:adenylosuccinate lyase
VLLKLIEKGMERQAAYVVVQRNAMKVWDEGRDFQQLLAEDADVARLLSREELASCFDLQRELRHVGEVFARVLGK